MDVLSLSSTSDHWTLVIHLDDQGDEEVNLQQTFCLLEATEVDLSFVAPPISSYPLLPKYHLFCLIPSKLYSYKAQFCSSKISLRKTTTPYRRTTPIQNEIHTTAPSSFSYLCARNTPLIARRKRNWSSKCWPRELSGPVVALGPQLSWQPKRKTATVTFASSVEPYTMSQLKMPNHCHA